MIAGALVAAGFSVGAASDAMGWILAAVALVSAAIVAWRLGAKLEVPAKPAERILLVWMFGTLLVGAYPISLLIGWWGMGIVAGLLAFATVLEAAMLPKPRTLEIVREIPPRLSLGALNTIRLRITNRGRKAVHLTVRDRAPWSLLPRGQPGSFVLAPGVTATHSYEVFPPARGAHHFEKTDLRITGYPGFVTRHVTMDVKSDTHVYPNLAEVARYALLLHRRRTHMVGIKVARKRGKGTEFETLRDYQPDDEFRDISWKASARTGKLITQTWQVERSQNVMILVEAGRMMSAHVPSPDVPPEARLTKLDHSINAALVLAQAAALKEDRVGVLAFAENVKAFLPPKRGRTQLTAIVDALHDLQPTLCEPDYGSAFQQLKLRAKRRSLVAIFTDLLDEESARLLLATLPLLAPQHLPLVIAVSDPSVAEIASSMPATGSDAFTGAVAGEMLHERRDILKKLRARGALVLDVAPGELSAAAVNKYLEIKARNLL